jgi:hypothetical protein
VALTLAATFAVAAGIGAVHWTDAGNRFGSIAPMTDSLARVTAGWGLRAVTLGSVGGAVMALVLWSLTRRSPVEAGGSTAGSGRSRPARSGPATRSARR